MLLPGLACPMLDAGGFHIFVAADYGDGVFRVVTIASALSVWD